jgi:NAD(P)-dependent dehydrogenase (short-subunit alcohol dehydrogenase family)
MTIMSDQKPVALFTGATAGLGEAILKAYARKHENSRIYLVGRNDAAAQQIIDDVQQMWKETSQSGEVEGDIIFVKADLTLLRNVREVVQEILRTEGDNAKLDFLCMSQGILTFKGRLGKGGFDYPPHYGSRLVFKSFARSFVLSYFQGGNLTEMPFLFSTT